MFECSNNPQSFLGLCRRIALKCSLARLHCATKRTKSCESHCSTWHSVAIGRVKWWDVKSKAEAFFWLFKKLRKNLVHKFIISPYIYIVKWLKLSKFNEYYTISTTYNIKFITYKAFFTEKFHVFSLENDFSATIGVSLKYWREKKGKEKERILLYLSTYRCFVVLFWASV